MGFVALCFFFFWPLGLVLLYTTRKYRKRLVREDWVILALLGALFLSLSLGRLFLGPHALV